MNAPEYPSEYSETTDEQLQVVLRALREEV
jgi:hypothetical protein